MSFQLSSTAFNDGQTIPTYHTCEGENISPPLAWKNAPKGTQSFAVILDDPDAPEGTFHHWAIYNIPARFSHLAEGLSADSDSFKQAHNDFGQLGYGGPCPPSGHGQHHYYFRLFALDIPSLNLPDQTKIEMVEKAVEPHLLEIAELTGLYAR